MRRALFALLLACAAASAAAQDPAVAPSEAERLLFLQEHLANVSRPRVLRFRYEEDAPGKARVSDAAVFTLRMREGGPCCDVHGEYLSGAMAVNLPDFTAARANPVVLYFLEGEVRRLERSTGGQAAHFRRQLRIALAETAAVSDSSIQWDAQARPARTVRVVPFARDPFRARFADQADIEYAFVLSDAVPGGVYQMSATLPGAGAPRARRTLTLEEDKR
ncbi:hypothetical protein HHL11_17615 [Ramlibacter sp. G-1-2-2]|uniref:DUF1571 domain-containing protein n=1 Tax=Ramlibacter agri TaxID=2728837 RepID=A0A848H453_9BURK|nr:hypothetical protein [Ramlibacter agri]NML45575.1 hypothetical protein [Ramlibacter agri]